MSDLLGKYVSAVTDGKKSYYSSYDVKYLSRQLEDMVDQLSSQVDSIENMNKAVRSESEEVQDESLISESAIKYQKLFSSLRKK
jgi:hypothetical protein